jgi:spore coat protein U-like protein
MRLTLPVIALGILASGLAVRPVDAAISSDSLSVTATVQASCLVSTADTVSRTNAGVANTASAVSVACSNSAPYSVSLDSGVVHGATVALRPITGSGFALLGDALGPNLTGIANGRQARNYDSTGFDNSSALELAIHDQFPAAQCAKPGAFADTMIVVVTY